MGNKEDSIKRIEAAVNDLAANPELIKMQEESDKSLADAELKGSPGGAEVTLSEMSQTAELDRAIGQKKVELLEKSNLSKEEQDLAVSASNNPAIMGLLKEHSGQTLPSAEDLYKQLGEINGNIGAPGVALPYSDDNPPLHDLEAQVEAFGFNNDSKLGEEMREAIINFRGELGLNIGEDIDLKFGPETRQITAAHIGSPPKTPIDETPRVSDIDPNTGIKTSESIQKITPEQLNELSHAANRQNDLDAALRATSEALANGASKATGANVQPVDPALLRTNQQNQNKAAEAEQGTPGGN